MANLRIHHADVCLTGGLRLRIHQVVLAALPAPGNRVLRIHSSWLTIGYEQPIGGGGTYARWQKAWVPSRRYVRWQGQWIGG